MTPQRPIRGEWARTSRRAAANREADEADDFARWLSFTGTRAGRRAERQEILAQRLRLGAAGLLALLLVAGVLAWRPWSSHPPADTGDAALGGDRPTVLLAVLGDDGRALLCGLLRHDRVARSGSVVVVPAGLVLPVPGEGRLAIAEAFDRAGPTLTSDAIGDALGVRVDGTWVLPSDQFAGLVDRLGGVEVSVERPVTRAGRTVVAAGAQRLDGAQALAYATQTHRDEPPMVAAGRMRQVLGALIAATPQTFSGARDLLGSLGVLGDAGVPVDRLAALLSGVARDAASGRLGSGALPIDRSSGGFDVAGGAPLVQDLLGGRPGTSPAYTTPRVMVQLPETDSRLAAAVRAAVVGGGYEYVEGGIGPKRRGSAVLVRDPAATAVGEAVALTLGLPRSSVRTAGDDVGDVPVVADVLVLLGYDAAI